jgi:hypothetical protein
MPVTEIPVRTPEEWDAVLGDFYARIEAAEAQLAAIVAERRTLALIAAEGDAGAQARVEELNKRHFEIVQSLDNLGTASVMASGHRREAAAREEAAAQAARLAEAEEVGRELVKCSKAVDAAFRAAVAALEKRKELAKRLSALGFPRNGFFHVEPVGRAAAAAGMRGHLPFIPGPMLNWRPLAETDGGAVTALIAPAKRAEREQREGSAAA